MPATAREVWGQDRRAAILEAAATEFGEHGYRGTSLALVAARVGITQQGVLHHFATKDQLLIAALEERERQDTDWWLSIYRSEDIDFLDLVVRLMEYEMGRRHQGRLLTVLAADSVTAGHPAYEFFNTRYAELRRGVAEALHLEEARTGRTLPAASVVVAIMDGLRLQWLLEPTFDLVGEWRAFVAYIRRPH